jgi:hypothetical protein
MNLTTSFVWNVIKVCAYDSLNRALIKQFVPSYYPLVNDDSYDISKSFKLDLYTPSNSSSANINLKVVYLVITSDFAIDRYQSVNVTNNRDLNLAKGGLYSPDFDGGLQIKVRNKTKNVLNVQLRNDDGRPYLAEQVLNFSIELKNTSFKIMNISGKNVSIPVPLDTVRIVILPYMNQAFYRVIINASQLYQDPSPLQVSAKV